MNPTDSRVTVSPCHCPRDAVSHDTSMSLSSGGELGEHSAHCPRGLQQNGDPLAHRVPVHLHGF